MDSAHLNLAVVLFVLTFIVSGCSKLLRFNTTISEGPRLSRAIGVSFANGERLVLLAGLFELVMAAMIIYGVYHEKRYLKPGIYGLMAFTAIVTLVFYSNPFKYKPFLSNLSVLTGLYLMLRVCEFK